MSDYKRYLGDGVYADVDGEYIVLTAEDGVHATSAVYLDEAVMRKLFDYSRYLAQLVVHLEDVHGPGERGGLP